MLYALAISSIVKVTSCAPSSVQPHGIRMIEFIASSSPWLPSSTFLRLGPFLWWCKVVQCVEWQQRLIPSGCPRKEDTWTLQWWRSQYM
uniref:Secreted protein n=1 Tax=Aegilops tauschii subsp. strangulata TaxID=200361 RepID=A0A453HYJ5_AEGTS